MRPYPLLVALSFIVVACGGSTSSSSSSTTGSGGGSSTGSGGGSSTSTNTTGAGGAATTTTTTTGTGGASGCVGSIELTEDDGAPIKLTSICASAWSDGRKDAVGFIFQGGAPPGDSRLQIVGCAGEAAGSQGIALAAKDAMGVGVFDVGASFYTDAGGTKWGVVGDPFSMTVTEFGAVGEPIVGSFQVMVTHGGNAAHNVNGTFHVCRVSDQLTP